MPPIPGMMQWHSLVARHAKNLRATLERATRALETHLSGQPQAKLEPILARNTPKQPLHPLARLRQGQNRFYSTARRQIDSAIRHFSTEASHAGPRFDRAAFPKSRVSAYIAQSSGRAPFASTLRPKLTGGALGRTAGGYSLGGGRAGGVRHFSHTPASQAQVVQNVSQAIRAFFVSGHKAQFDGFSSSGEKRYKTVSALQEDTGRKLRDLPRASPGSWIKFPVNPTITALTPLSAVTGFDCASHPATEHLNTNGLLDVLSVDFSRALEDLAAIFNDLKRLSALGDLPLTYEGSEIRVHFPGCDADTVERLCEELSITRGMVVQDESFDAFVGTDMALLFPFAPSDQASEDSASFLYDEPASRKHGNRSNIALKVCQSMLTPSSPAYSTQSAPSAESEYEDILLPSTSSPSGYETVRSGSPPPSSTHDPLEYQGFEGIYRFIEELDSVRR
nr:hypothetical protein CFP56_01092 [Quercus suber]